MLGEAPHLARDDRKAAAGIARARRLDGGVEREEVGLEGDVLDQDDHLGDALRGGDLVHRRHGVGGHLAALFGGGVSRGLRPE